MTVSSTDSSLDWAYAYCTNLAKAHYENFPVASRLLPSQMRSHVSAVYAFARVADDFVDEGDRSPDERHRLLDQWLARFYACISVDSVPQHHYGTGDEALFVALGNTIRVCKLPLSPFEDLLSAFRQDITTHRYDTWDDLLHYCRRSANPIGRLVLRIAGYQDSSLDRASDCLCSALQLTNFWQDLDRDYQRGRLYIPEVDWRACSASLVDLDERNINAAWRCALERVSRRTRELFYEARNICDGVHGRLRFELRLTWLGGMRILDDLERMRYDMFTKRPALGVTDSVPLLWKAIRWK